MSDAKVPLRGPAEPAITDAQLQDAARYIEEEEGAVSRFRGWLGRVTTVLLVVMSLYHLYAAVDIVPAQVLRPVHVGFLLLLGLRERVGRVGHKEDLRHLFADFLDELLGRREVARHEDRVHALRLPLLDEAVELRLGLRGVAAVVDRQDRGRPRLHAELLQARLD